MLACAPKRPRELCISLAHHRKLYTAMDSVTYVYPILKKVWIIASAVRTRRPQLVIGQVKAQIASWKTEAAVVSNKFKLQIPCDRL
jgi:hypothetical protein